MVATRDRASARRRVLPEQRRPRGEQHARPATPAEPPPAPETRPRRPRPSSASLGAVAIFIALAGYFVWLCTEMAGHAPGGIGGSSLVAIAIAFGAGILAAALAMLWSRRGRGDG